MKDDESPNAETWEPRPVPDVTPETEPFWTAAAEGKLRLGHCPECGLTFFYPRAHCPDCLAEAETVPSSGAGRIYSYSLPNQVSGWPEEHLPLVVAYVALEEGPRLVTNIVDCEPEEVRIGREVKVDFVPVEEDDIAIPVFRLD